MKIEICENTLNIILIIGLCILAGYGFNLIYKYNSHVYEKGYTQIQRIGSAEKMWVKEK